LDIPIEVLRAWIERYHPAIINGDTSVNAVTIVVDANDNYVKSATDRVPETDSDFRMGAFDANEISHVEVVKGSYAATLYGPDALNGVVVVTTKKSIPQGRTDSVTSDSAVTVIRRKLDSTARPGAANPLYIVDGVTMRSPTPLQYLHVDPEQLQAIELMKLAAGQIGPNALHVIVVKLKRGIE
jgi:hypothetical protein